MVAPFVGILLLVRGRTTGRLQGRGWHEIGLASAAILIQLLHRLIDKKLLLPREQVLALMGDAADEIIRPGAHGLRHKPLFRSEA